MTRLPQLAGQEHFVDDRVDFVKIEHQIQFTNIVEVFVEDLDEVMDGLQVEQVVVGHVYADAKVEAGVPPIDDLVVSELDEIRVLGIAD